MRFRCKTMMQIIGPTSRGLINGSRVTDRQIGVEDGQTGGRNRDDDDGMMAVAVLL
jgi:hypothetical protein